MTRNFCKTRMKLPVSTDGGQNSESELIEPFVRWYGGYDDANTTYCSFPGSAAVAAGASEIQTPQLPLARSLVR